MKKIEILNKKEYNKLKKNKDGDYEISSNLEIFIEESVEDKIAILQEELNRLVLPEIPSDEELIAFAKINHPYYEMLNLRNTIQQNIYLLNGN
jgi:hypothetical protein